MFVDWEISPGPQRCCRADDDLQRIGHPMPDKLRVVEECALVFLTVARSFRELGGRHDQLLVGEAHQTLRVLSSVVGCGRLSSGSDQVLFCRLHVDVGFCQPQLSGHGSLVGRAHPLLNVASLTGGIGLPHISEEFAGIRIHLTRIRFNPTGIRHYLAPIGARLALVGSHFARICVRLPSIGKGCAFVRGRLPDVRSNAPGLGGTSTLALASTLLIHRIHQRTRASSTRVGSTGSLPSGGPQTVETMPAAR